jgi:hypothetical protein
MIWPFNSPYFWKGFWSQMGVQAPIVIGLLALLIAHAIWSYL